MSDRVLITTMFLIMTAISFLLFVQVIDLQNKFENIDTEISVLKKDVGIFIMLHPLKHAGKRHKELQQKGK